MKDIRVAVGMGLLDGFLVIFLSGFVAHSSRDVMLMIAGFAFGMISVYLLERIKSWRRA
ncbi:MAG: hypothetical protein GX557_13720 [Chloroflexi bacterium]|nr:hypothetical protein [Chloroflexota bacterium]